MNLGIAVLENARGIREEKKKSIDGITFKTNLFLRLASLLSGFLKATQPFSHNLLPQSLLTEHDHTRFFF